MYSVREQIFHQIFKVLNIPKQFSNIYRSLELSYDCVLLCWIAVIQKKQVLTVGFFVCLENNSILLHIYEVLLLLCLL